MDNPLTDKEAIDIFRKVRRAKELARKARAKRDEGAARNYETMNHTAIGILYKHYPDPDKLGHLYELSGKKRGAMDNPRRLSAYQQFVKREMAKAKPKTLAEARAAMRAAADKWRERNPISDTGRSQRRPTSHGLHTIPIPDRPEIRALHNLDAADYVSGELYHIPKGETGLVMAQSSGRYWAIFDSDQDRHVRLIVPAKAFEKIPARRNPDFREGELVRIRGLETYGAKEGKVVEKEPTSALGLLRGREYYQVRIETPKGPETVLVRERALKSLNPRGKIQVITADELWDRFVGSGASKRDIAKMQLTMMAQQIGELRQDEEDDIELTDLEIARTLKDFAAK